MSYWASWVDPPTCGVRMTLSSPRSTELNGSPCSFGSSGNTSTAAPAMCPLRMWSRRASWSTTNPRERLRNRLRRRMRANCSAPNSPALPARPSTTQRHGLRALEQLLQAAAGLGVPQCELVLQVVEQHPHAQSLGQHRELAADVAVANDAQSPTPDLMASGRRLVPDTCVQRTVSVDQPPSQADDLRDRQLD